MALKKTSETIMIGVSTPQFGGNVAESQVDLQLNPLDNEVFVVQAVEFDLFRPLTDTDFQATQAGKVAGIAVSISTTSRTTVGSLADSNVLAACHATMTTDQTTNDIVSIATEQKPDTAASILDYIGIIATADFFVQTQSANEDDGLNGGSLRLYGYRAKADAATYAALVQSEVLSS